MAITKDEKQGYAVKFGTNDTDTGNSQVQVAIMTQRIRSLTDHLKVNPKDSSTRLGLMKLVGKRRRLLKYLEKNQIETYRSLIKELAIRK